MFNFVITYDFGACQCLGQSYLQFPATRAELQLYAEGQCRFEKEGEDALDTL